MLDAAHHRALAMLDADGQPLLDDAMRFVGHPQHALQLLLKAIGKEAALLSLCHKYWPQRLSPFRSNLRATACTPMTRCWRPSWCSVSMPCTVRYGVDLARQEVLSHISFVQLDALNRVVHR